MKDRTPRTDFGLGGSLKGSFVGTDNGIVPDSLRAPQENGHLMEQVGAMPENGAGQIHVLEPGFSSGEDGAYVA